MKKPLEFRIDDNGCFLPTSHKAKAVKGRHQGGRIRKNGNSVSMARWLYKELMGDIPDSLVIRHSCSNGLCINIEHMTPGTPAENSRDMIESGRNTCGPRILDEEKAIDIRKCLTAGDAVKDIAKRYGVKPATIYDIKNNRSWTPENIERRLKARQSN